MDIHPENYILLALAGDFALMNIATIIFNLLKKSAFED